MAVPTVVGVGAVSSSASAITPALPSGVQENDILVLVMESYYNQVPTCTGYTQLLTYGNVTPYSQITILWKRAGASESAPTTSDSGDHQTGCIMAVRGCITTGNPFGEWRTGSFGGGSTASLPAFTTYVSDCLVIGAIAPGNSSKTVSSAQWSSWTNSNLTNIVEQVDNLNSAGSGGGLGIFTATKASAGSVTTSTASQNSYIAGATAIGTLIPDTVTKPYVRGTGTVASGTGAISAPLTPGTAENDIVVTFVETNNEAVSVTGYTEATSSPASNSGTNPTRLSVFYKRAGTSEGDAAVSDSGDHQIARTMSVVGCVASGNPFNAAASSTGGTGTSLTIPGATTTRTNSLVVAAAVSSSNTSFSGWTNSNLSNIFEVIDSGAAVGTAGAIGVAVGSYAGSGSYGNTTATAAASAEWAAWSGALVGPENTTLSADVGSISLTGADVYFGRLWADASGLSATGADALFNKGFTLALSPATFTATGQNAALILGRGIAAAPGTLSFASSTSTFDQCVKIDSNEISLESGGVSSWVPTPAVSKLNFFIDVSPAVPDGSYRSYSERLTVDGQSVAVKSWTYTEENGGIGGKLQLELANVLQKSLFTADAVVVFELGIKQEDGSWTWTSLLDTGALANSQYAVRSDGNGPRDTFTVTAMTEMEDRLSKSPSANTVFYDPTRETVQAARTLPSLVDVDGNVTPSETVAISGMDLYAILQRVFITECGFSSYRTNIPNFRIGHVDFEAGVPWSNTIGALIGMFEPTYSVVHSGGSLILCVNDGTVARTPGMPSPKQVTVSNTTALGLASDFSPTLGKIGAVEVTLNNEGLSVFQYINTRTTEETQRTGDIQGDNNQYTDRYVKKTFLDLYDSRYGSAPFNSVLIEQETTVDLTKWVHYSYWEVDPDDSTKDIKVQGGTYVTVRIEASTEKFQYQYGIPIGRYKTVSCSVPVGKALQSGEPSKNQDGVTYYQDELDEYYAYEQRPVLEEIEEIERSLHPFNPGEVYVSKRVTVQNGLVLVDTAETQAGKAFIRPALEVVRSGNLKDGLKTDWMRLSTVVETLDPQSDGTVQGSKVQTDFTADQVAYEEWRIDDGKVGTNALKGNTKKVLVYPSGETALDGQAARLNAGALPLDIAAALAKRKLKLQRKPRQSFSFDIPGVDLSIEQGSLIEARGRSGESLGTFAVESRTITGSERGHTMSVQAKSAYAD